MQTKCIDVQNYFPGNIYVFKVNNRNTRKRYNFMFKVNGKNTRMRSFWCSYCQLWTYFTAFYSVSIVSWVVWNHKIIIQHSQHQSKSLHPIQQLCVHSQRWNYKFNMLSMFKDNTKDNRTTKSTSPLSLLLYKAFKVKFKQVTSSPI